MLESLLAQILSDVSRRPRLLLHVVIALIFVTVLKLAGIYLPCNTAEILGLEEVVARERGVLVGLDVVIALSLLLTYFILITILYRVIDRALKKALENLSIEDSFRTIERIRQTCFVKDVTSNHREKWYRLMVLLLFSLVTGVSYYSAIAFSLYALNDWSSMLAFPFLSLLTSKSVAVPTVISLTLVAILLGFMVALQQRRGIEGLEDRGLLEEWFEDIIFKYLFENCVGRRGSDILLCLAPVSPKLRMPYLRYFTLVVPQEMAKARLNELPSYEIKDAEKFSNCIDRVLLLGDLSEGVFKRLCMAKLYEKSNSEKKFLGVLMGFSTVVIIGPRHPLRLLSKHRAIVPARTDEQYTYLAVLAVDPAAGEFIVRLVTG